jgi:hypothetical protein
MNKSIVAAGALALLASASAARACEVAGQKVLEVMTDAVGTYDREGNFLADVPKTQVEVGADILDCQESPALVQVSLKPQADGKGPTRAWVNLLEVKVGKGTVVARECKQETVSRLADTTAPATSGIDPCSNASQPK